MLGTHYRIIKWPMFFIVLIIGLSCVGFVVSHFQNVIFFFFAVSVNFFIIL